MRLKTKFNQGTTSRIFTYQGSKFVDPLPGFAVAQVQILLAQSLPELLRCAWNINIDPEGREVIEFTSTG